MPDQMQCSLNRTITNGTAMGWDGTGYDVKPGFSKK